MAVEPQPWLSWMLTGKRWRPGPGGGSGRDGRGL